MAIKGEYVVAIKGFKWTVATIPSCYQMGMASINRTDKFIF